jgi:hypothetical protein
MEDCTVAASSEGTRPARWKLKAEVRRAVLRSMRGREALLRALEANAEEAQAAEQRMMTACIRGQIPPLDQLSEHELSELLDAVFWLDEVLEGLPGREQLQRLLEQKRLLSPFEYLVGSPFQGREDELNALRAFVGLIPPESVLTKLRHLADSFWKGEPSVLVINGPGGVGKSTLLSKFLLEHARVAPEQRIPFAYLDFDNPRFSFDEPLVLFLEVVRQLGVQYAEVRPYCEIVSARLGEQSRLSAEDRGLQVPRVREVLRNMAEVMMDVVTHPPGAAARRGQEGKASQVPFLLVLDTFEEVQTRSPLAISQVQRFLQVLREAYATVRVVISGRAPIPELEVNGRAPRSLPLTELDEPAAQGLLRAHGVKDAELSLALMRQVGRNPLSLKLAAAVAEREGLSRGPIRDLKTTQWLLFSAKETVIQGQLYQRILGHIRNQDVCKLAHPGLVLRQVTPELIREVLAHVCDIRLSGAGAEQTLFEELRKEVSLVSLAGPNRVKHRADVRAVMLDLLVRDRPVQVEAIHRAAVAFYARSTLVADRAEELYHRLMLGEPATVLSDRWMEGVGELLVGSLQEMPPSSQAFLAAKMGLYLPEDIRSRADLESWERLTAETIRRVLEKEGIRDIVDPERIKLGAVLGRMFTEQGPSILVVDGPRRSGRTYTRVLIQRLAARHGDFHVAVVDPWAVGSLPLDVSSLAGELSLRMGSSWESMPEQTGTSARWVQQLASWVLAQAARTAKRWWVVIDGLDDVEMMGPDTRAFIETLAQQIAIQPAQRPRLALLAYPHALPASIRRETAFITLPARRSRVSRDFLEVCLSLLRERSERSDGSALYPLEAELLFELGEYEELERLLEEEALTKARRASDTRALLTLLLLLGRQKIALGELVTGRAWLTEAAELAFRRGDVMARLDAHLALLQTMPGAGGERSALREELVRTFTSTPESVLKAEPAVCRRIVGELGAEHRDVLLTALRATEVRTGDQIEALGRLLESRFADRRSAVLARLAHLDLPFKTPEPSFVEMLLVSNELQRLDQMLVVVLNEVPPNAEVDTLIAQMIAHSSYRSDVTPGA